MSDKEEEQTEKRSRGSAVIQWMGSTDAKVYSSRALTSWGDRMWDFALGLYMVRLDGFTLRLAAIFGFVSSFAVIIFGGPIGELVDRMPRLKAAKVALITQNSCVALCAVVLCMILTYQEFFVSTWNGNAMLLGQIVVIALAIISRLASVASGLIVDKDWIVELAERDSKRLAGLNAMLRRIDLTSLVIAPAVVGLIMTGTSLISAAIFLAVWNVLSFFVEFYLLWKIYYSTPQLQVDKKLNKNQAAAPAEDSCYVNASTGNNEENNYKTSEKEEGAIKETQINFKNDKNKDEAINVYATEMIKDEKQAKMPKKKRSVKIARQLKMVLYGWKIYFKQDVVFAGISLACLFMTVLGFDSITVGYAYIQGISESFMGWMSALSGVFGIAGTLIYPQLHKRIGLNKTGIFGLTCLVSVLSLCVISIWVPGSPFDLNKVVQDPMPKNQTNATLNGTEEGGLRYESIGLFITGVILARFGLWIGDLAISQLYQEHVKQTERGKVNGVQKSLEEGMNVLKFICVIVAPRTETFGILIIISFTFIVFSWLSFVIYARKTFTSCCCDVTEANDDLDGKPAQPGTYVKKDIDDDYNGYVNKAVSPEN